MPLPISPDSDSLGRAAIKNAPRLAGIFMAAHHTGQPLMVTSHPANGSSALSTVLTLGDPLSQWARRTVEDVENRAKQVVESAKNAAAAPAPTPAARTALSPIADVYRRLIGEKGQEFRRHTVDEVVEATQPAEVGKSAAVANRGDRNAEIMALSAVIIGSGFGDQVDRAKTDGAFDVTVFRNVYSAAQVIAPDKPLASLMPVELNAIVTAALVSSNSAFLQHLRGTQSIPASVMEAAKSPADGGKAAAEFMDGGHFSETLFRKKVQRVALDVAMAAGAAPATVKLALLAVAAEKAQQLLPEMQKHGDWHSDIEDKVRRSVNDRLESMKMDEKPAERPSAPGEY